MNIYELTDLLEELFPSEYALKDDRIGLQIHLEQDKITNLLVAYEITENVVDEAIAANCNTILVFHPLIYHPLREIKQNDRVGYLATKLIKHNISVISLHTRFDVVANGTSFAFASKIGLANCKILDPSPSNPNYGMGCWGILPSHPTLEDFLDTIIKVVNAPIRFCEGNKKRIKTVGIVGGSGSSYISKALELNLDAFITSDISYHQFHSAKSRIVLIDCGHFETEQFIVPTLTKVLKDKLGNVEIGIIASTQLTNPIQYYPNTSKYLLKQQEYVKKINKV